MATALSTVAATKAALRTQLAARPGLQGVQVVYGDGDTRRRESIRLREATTAAVVPTALAPGRRKREETFDLSVEVEVIGQPTPEKNEARAVTLMGEVDGLLADDPHLGGAVDGLLFAMVTGWQMDTGQATDGPQTVVTVTVTVRSRLQ